MVDVDGLMLAVNVVLVASAGSTVPPPIASQWTVLAGLVEIVTFSPIPNVVLALFAGVVACLALVINLLLIFGIMILVSATVT